MKKFVFLFFGMLLLPLAIMAQDPTPSPVDLNGYVGTFLAYVASCLALTELLSTFIKKEGSRKWLTWVVAILIGLLAFLLHLGIFFAVWPVGLMYVVIAGLVGSGYITTAQGELLVDLLKDWLTKLGEKKTEVKK